MCLSMLKWKEWYLLFFHASGKSQQVPWFTSKNCLAFYTVFTHISKKILLEMCHFYRETCLSSNWISSPHCYLWGSTRGRRRAVGMLQDFYSLCGSVLGSTAHPHLWRGCLFLFLPLGKVVIVCQPLGPAGVFLAAFHLLQFLFQRKVLH